MKRSWYVVPLLCAVAGFFSVPVVAQTTTALRADERVTLSFDNAEIAEVARTIGIIIGRSVVVDPRVRGTMTLTTNGPVLRATAYDLFLATLRVQGFTMVEAAGLYKVVPEADAKLQAGSVRAGGRTQGSGVSAGPGNQIATEIFRLNYETASNLVPVLRPLINPNNTINVNPGNNSLIITDYTDNLRRLATIIAALDIPNATGVEIIRLQHAIATDLAPLVTRLIDSGAGGIGGAGATGQGQPDNAFRTTLLAEPRSNSLILRAANPARLALVRTLVDKLDQAAAGTAGKEGETGNIYVVYLKNADATRMAATLRAALLANTASSANLAAGSATSVTSSPGGGSVFSGGSGSGGAGGFGGAGGNSSLTASLVSAQPSTGGQIQADPSTNSLIITAPAPQYRQLRAVIDRLDTRRAQVFIESLIAEVNVDKAAEFGIQFQNLLGRNAAIGSNFSVGGTNIITLATQARSGGVVPSTGFNLGLAGGTGVLTFLARFLESSGNGNILSTPNLLTLDNEEARIVIGQNVPFVTGSYTNNNTSTGAVNPFQTVERKDVGLTLRVKPQISEDGTVKMQIFQESSSVQASSINSATGLITNKRSIESNVLVNDGAIVVLGGLLQDEYAGNREQVPILGDIPVLGNLFRAETRSRRRTNLMVFLRPVVVRDAPSTESLSIDRYELMRGAQRNAQPVPNVLVPVNEAPVMPPLPLQSPPQPPSPLPPLPPSSLPPEPMSPGPTPLPPLQ